MFDPMLPRRSAIQRGLRAVVVLYNLLILIGVVTALGLWLPGSMEYLSDSAGSWGRGLLVTCWVLCLVEMGRQVLLTLWCAWVRDTASIDP